MHNPFVGTRDRIWGGDDRSEGALTGRMRVADRSGELCPLPVPSCLPTGPTQELRHALWALTPLNPQHSPPRRVSGDGLEPRLVPGTRPGGEKGGGDGEGSSCEHRAKCWSSVGSTGTLLQPRSPSPTCPAVPRAPVSSSTTSEGKTPTRPSKSPVQKPSSTSSSARGSTRMMAPSGKLSSSGLCPS